MAVVAGCVPALQPILLGALLDAGRIGAHQVGQAATAEALGMVAATLTAGALLPPRHLRLLAALCGLAMLAANGSTLYLAAQGIIAARFVNGFASGIILWMLVGLLSRVAAPGRLFAVYVTAQSVLAFLLSSAMTAILLPKLGMAGGYGALLVLSAVPLLLAIALPPAFAPIEGGGGAKRPTAAGFASLVAVALFMAGVFSAWVYVLPLARQMGHADSSIGTAISMGIAIQIIGGLAAMRLADRWNGALTTAVAALVGAGAAMLLLLPAGWALYAATGLIAFVWMFTPSFHIPMLMTFDPSGRSAIFIGTAQIGGVALGPTLASMTIGGTDYRGVVAISASAFACAILLLVALTLTRKENMNADHSGRMADLRG
jgi:predicted MFS family arabinose efflux permease